MINIKLDTHAVRALIGDDEGVKLELQRAVIAEIARKVVFKDAGDLLQLIQPVMMKELLAAIQQDAAMSKLFEDKVSASLVKWESAGWNQKATLKADQKVLVERAVSEAIETHRAKATASAVERYEELVEAHAKAFEARIDAKLERAIDMRVQERIDRGVAERIAALKANL